MHECIEAISNKVQQFERERVMYTLTIPRMTLMAVLFQRIPMMAWWKDTVEKTAFLRIDFKFKKKLPR